jgi:hypothetical protein
MFLSKLSHLYLDFSCSGSIELRVGFGLYIGKFKLLLKDPLNISNSLMGMNGNSSRNLDEPRLTIFSVLILGMQWMETLTRLNIMVINPGGWAVP